MVTMTTFKPGDIVRDEFGVYGVVTALSTADTLVGFIPGNVFVVWEDGACENCNPGGFTNTGKNIDILEWLSWISEHPKTKHILCKDCQYFVYDQAKRVDGVPLIAAHEICTKWGNGCKTSENGYCFMAERKEE